MNILNQKNLNISLLLLLLACTANSFGMEQAVSRLATSVSRAARTRLAYLRKLVTPRNHAREAIDSLNRIQVSIKNMIDILERGQADDKSTRLRFKSYDHEYTETELKFKDLAAAKKTYDAIMSAQGNMYDNAVLDAINNHASIKSARNKNTLDHNALKQEIAEFEERRTMVETFRDLR